MTSDPKRLLDTETGALGKSLANAKTQLPSSERLARIAERLAQAGVVIPPEPSPPLETAAPAKSLGIAAKAGLGVVGVGTALLAFALAMRTNTEPARPAPSSPSAQPAQPPVRNAPGVNSATQLGDQRNRPRSARPAPSFAEPEREAIPSPRPIAPPAGEMAPPPEQSVRTLAPRAGREPSPRPDLPAPLDAPEPSTDSTSRGGVDVKEEPTKSSEVELLKRARDAVASDPARALAIARRHRAEFPNGVFAQERDFIAISALVRQARVDEANALANAFRNRYPRSAYLPQLERMLGTPR